MADDWIREDDEWPEPVDPDDGYEDDDVDEVDEVDEVDDGYDDGGPRGSGRWLVAVAVMLVLGLGVVAALALTGDDGGESASDVDTGSTTTRALALPGLPTSTTTSGPTSTSPTVAPGGGGGGSSTSTTKKSTATTKPVTTSSTLKEDTQDPDCSAQGSSNLPGDPYPVTISFCVDDAHPKAGQTVRITGVAKDQDSQVEADCIKVTFDDEDIALCAPVSNPSNPIANREFVVTHAFTAGVHTIHAAAVSDPPKGGSAATSYKITVHA